MVQKAKSAEVSANSLADDSSESDEGSDPAPSSSSSTRALKEQGQTPVSGTAGGKLGIRGGVGRDPVTVTNKDSIGSENDSRRDIDARKENYRQDDPKEQRANRRLKENRERRFENRDSRDNGRRGDRREAPPMKDREPQKTAVAK